MKSKFVFNKYTNTIRLMPENYWLASVTDGHVIFDSWDGATKKLFDSGIITKKDVINFFNTIKL